MEYLPCENPMKWALCCISIQQFLFPKGGIAAFFVSGFLKNRLAFPIDAILFHPKKQLPVLGKLLFGCFYGA